MNARRLFTGLSLSVLCLAAASPALGLANRVFVSARSGNNANSCDNVNTPCQTLQGAINQLNPDGEAIVLDSGGYGPVTITQAVTIEAPAGITAFIHPSSGNAITVNAGSARVTLRGLVLNVGTAGGILVSSVGTLNVENCFITGFTGDGIAMTSSGKLNLKGTDIKACGVAVHIVNTAGSVQAAIDHCHLDGSAIGFDTATVSPGSSTTAASYTTANNNSSFGWICGDGASGLNVLNLEFCTGSQNGDTGLLGFSSSVLSVARYSNCVFSNNGSFGVRRLSAAVESRGTSTIEGNLAGDTSGTIVTIVAK